MNQVESYLNENHLCHYGVLGMKWGVRKYKPYPEGHKNAGNAEKVAKRQAGLDRVVRKSEKKLNKYTRRADKKRVKADKYWEKGDREEYRLFGNEARQKVYYHKAAKLDNKTTRYETKGARWYKHMDRTFSKANIKMSEKARKQGEDFINYMNDRRSTRYASRHERRG